MPHYKWYEDSQTELVANQQIAESGGGGATFPDFTGAGSPEGVITAAIGKFYGDTSFGALYVKTEGSGNTGWTAIGGGADPAAGMGTVSSGGMFSQAGFTQMWMAATENIAGTTYAYNRIADPVTLAANPLAGLAWVLDNNGVRVQIALADANALWSFKNDKTTEFPGALFVGAGDVTLTTGGLVITDSTDGHQYRIISTNGVLSTVQVV